MVCNVHLHFLVFAPVSIFRSLFVSEKKTRLASSKLFAHTQKVTLMRFERAIMFGDFQRRNNCLFVFTQLSAFKSYKVWVVYINVFVRVYR